MGYVKTTWVDRAVATARRYLLTLVSTDTYDISAVTGTVTQEGTQVTAIRMNNIENAIETIYNGGHIYSASSAGSDTYVLTFSPAFSAYVTGMAINMKVDVANTGAGTLNINALGAKAIKKFVTAGKADIATGDIVALGVYTLVYDGTDFVLLNPHCVQYPDLTNKGDIVHASSANVLARFGIGTTKQILSVNSAGDLPEWINTEVELYSGALGADTAQLDITVPTGYKYLRLVASVLCSTSTSRNLHLRCNDDNGSNQYTYQIEDSTLNSSTSIYIPIGITNAISGTLVANIINIQSGVKKTFFCDHAQIHYAQLWSSWNNTTDDITKISLYLSADSLKTGSTFRLYGRK